MKLAVIYSVGLFIASTSAGHLHRRDARPLVTTLSTLQDYVTDDVSVTVYVDDSGTSTDLPPSSAAAAASSYSPTPVDNEAVVATTSASAASAASAAPSYSASNSDSSSGASVSGYLSSSDSFDATQIQGDLSYPNKPADFQDGVHSCDEVPTGNGVIPIPWLNSKYSGWASILSLDGYASTTCKEGYYCSYACQPGMSKTQWPESQPSNGVSIGGLVCKNGKLFRTNSATALCEWDAPSANAVSKLDKVVSLCRTDYPGSENMNIPTRLTPGSTKPMSVVNSDTYYTWKGGSTSAQYYVNNAGVDVDKGCIWGTDGSGIGNWAPVVLGAGKTGSTAYLSIIPNPNNKTPPNYNLAIVAASGSTQSGTCLYVNGAYSGGSDGCTVGTQGTSNFVFYSGSSPN